eukprot:m.55169 g.55169  ORF g.55169 m.55169 type:complete len:1144 (+) comp48845_c0_seq1:924-4355(+)
MFRVTGLQLAQEQLGGFIKEMESEFAQHAPPLQLMHISDPTSFHSGHVYLTVQYLQDISVLVRLRVAPSSELLHFARLDHSEVTRRKIDQTEGIAADITFGLRQLRDLNYDEFWQSRDQIPPDALGPRLLFDLWSSTCSEHQTSELKASHWHHSFGAVHNRIAQKYLPKYAPQFLCQQYGGELVVGVHDKNFVTGVHVPEPQQARTALESSIDQRLRSNGKGPDGKEHNRVFLPNASSDQVQVRTEPVHVSPDCLVAYQGQLVIIHMVPEKVGVLNSFLELGSLPIEEKCSRDLAFPLARTVQKDFGVLVLLRMDSHTGRCCIALPTVHPVTMISIANRAQHCEELVKALQALTDRLPADWKFSVRFGDMPDVAAQNWNLQVIRVRFAQGPAPVYFSTLPKVWHSNSQQQLEPLIWSDIQDAVVPDSSSKKQIHHCLSHSEFSILVGNGSLATPRSALSRLRWRLVLDFSQAPMGSTEDVLRTDMARLYFVKQIDIGSPVGSISQRDILWIRVFTPAAEGLELDGLINAALPQACARPRTTIFVRWCTEDLPANAKLAHILVHMAMLLRDSCSIILVVDNLTTLVETKSFLEARHEKLKLRAQTQQPPHEETQQTSPLKTQLSPHKEPQALPAETQQYSSTKIPLTLRKQIEQFLRQDLQFIVANESLLEESFDLLALESRQVCPDELECTLAKIPEAVMASTRFQRLEILYRGIGLQDEDATNIEHLYQGYPARWIDVASGRCLVRHTFDAYVKKLQACLKSNGASVTPLALPHLPGAGGTSLGRYLLWTFRRTHCCGEVLRLYDSLQGDLAALAALTPGKPLLILSDASHLADAGHAELVAICQEANVSAVIIRPEPVLANFAHEARTQLDGFRTAPLDDRVHAAEAARLIEKIRHCDLERPDGSDAALDGLLVDLQSGKSCPLFFIMLTAFSTKYETLEHLVARRTCASWQDQGKRQVLLVLAFAKRYAGQGLLVDTVQALLGRPWQHHFDTLVQSLLTIDATPTGMRLRFCHRCIDDIVLASLKPILSVTDLAELFSKMVLSPPAQQSQSEASTTTASPVVSEFELLRRAIFDIDDLSPQTEVQVRPQIRLHHAFRSAVLGANFSEAEELLAEANKDDSLREYAASLFAELAQLRPSDD